jgi:carotenoid cleavage dioxygenase
VAIYVISPAGEIVREEWFEAPYPSMMHDYLVSQDYIIFHISPMIADWERLKAGVPFFQWDPRHESLVGVIPRRQGVSGIRWFSSPTVMQTHTINASNDGDQLTLDHFVAASGWLSQFPDADGLITEEKPPIAQRWTFDLGSGRDTFTSSTLVDLPGDMPRVDPRHLTRPNRHMWMGAFDLDLGPMVALGPMGPPFNCLIHLDHETGVRQHHYPGPDNAPEEPVFVPRSAAEGDGYLISVVGRRRDNRSDAVILDALRLADGPLATIKIPYRLRYAFHGTWAPAEELNL